MRRLYGASALHLLGVVASLAFAVYAGQRLLSSDGPGVGTWWVAGILFHDIALVGLYTLIDRLFRRFPWRNYVRVPAALSGLLLLMWSPLILRLADRYESTSGRDIDPYLGNWVKVTVALFAGSLLTYVVSRVRLSSAAANAAPQTTAPPG